MSETSLVAEPSSAPAETPAAPSQDHVALSDVFLPDDIRSDPSLKDIGTVTDMAKRMITAQKMVGAEKFVIPGKEATDEDWAKVYNALGRPGTAEEYGIKVREGFEDIGISEDLLKGYADAAHKNGLNTKQTNAMLDFYAELTAARKAENDKAIADNNEKWIGEIQKELGNAFNKKLNVVGALLSNVEHGDEFRNLLNESGLGANPVAFRFLLGLASRLGEDRLEGLDNQAKSNNGRLSPQEAMAEIAKIDAMPEINDVHKPEFAAKRVELLKRREQLIYDAFPQQES